jgi:fatty-acyl-CoA synthase
MATIVADDGRLDLAAFRTHLVEQLPDYARPLFLRVRDELAVTATFKHTKSALVREGYDPVAIDDALYFNDRERQAFIRLDKALYDRIHNGQLAFITAESGGGSHETREPTIDALGVGPVCPLAQSGG